MILKLRSPFKVEAGDTEENQLSTSSRKSSSSVVVGLRIITQNSKGKSNVVVNSALKINLPTSRKHRHGHSGGGGSPADDHQSCFLKSCHLCNKNLSLDKEVYMYRGDQGFCSIECRNRQIVLDEMRELEQSTKQMLASYRHCNTSGRRETRRILEDLRRRNKTPHQNQNHWAIVS
ncbi:hypothetical protein CCACVL1_18825 [Corchorus capsularis]|uniref:FLZ-type domain-containing protein n=1 Tax=Corchorus capsularis TaxID=210143 RepID=A0A1R3HJQ4_COCAP|nr:hypothetical protein CCACVL1_18825 [Corchorus capsularis]